MAHARRGSTAETVVIAAGFVAVAAVGFLVAATFTVARLEPPAPGRDDVASAPRDRTPAQPAPSHRVLKRVNGPFGPLEVVEGPHGRAILCNGVVQTLVPRPGLGVAAGTLLSGRDYVELIPYFRPQTRRALLVGVGAGLDAQGLAAHGIEVQGVDIDPAMIALAREYFGLSIDVTIADGRAFLQRIAARYDAIIVDAFVGEKPAAHLSTREAFALMSERLKPGGVVALHLISRPQDPQTQAAARTLQNVFGRVVAARSGMADEIQHIYLFASREPLELLPEHRLELARYGFTGSELYEVDTRRAPLLTDRVERR